MAIPGIDDNDLKRLSNLSSNFNNVANATNNYQQNIIGLNKDLEEFNDLTSQLNQSLKNQVANIKDSKSPWENYYDLVQKAKIAQKELNEGTERYNDLISKVQQSAQVESIIKDGINSRRKLGEELTKTREAQTKLNEELSKPAGQQNQNLINQLRDEAIKKAENLAEHEENARKLAYAIAGEWDNAGVILDDYNSSLADAALEQAFINEQLDDENQNANRRKKMLEATLPLWQKITSKVLYWKKTLEETQFGKFISAQLDAIGISFASMLKNVMAYDQMLTDSAKQLGISKDGARTLAGEYERTAYNAKEFNSNAEQTLMTQKAQFEAQSQLNASLGTAGLFTAKSRVDQAFLTKQIGLQGTEAAKIYQLGKLSGIDAEKTSKIVAQEVINSGKQNKNKLDYKQILSDVAKVEGQLAVQYQNNPELITKAVTQAKQLGLELQQTSKMADSLLNFESSISNELKAELLTGKALNLEKARELALRGDSAAAAKELMDNVGGLSEFQNLNVLQQRSLADAIGLGVDELSNALATQKLLAGTGIESKEAFEEMARNAKTEDERQALFAQLRQADNADQLIKQASQISNQERFNSLIEKLRETFTSMMEGPVGGILNFFSKILQSATALKLIVGAVGTIMAVSWSAGIIKSITALGPLLVKMGIVASEAALANSFITFGAGIVVAAAAVAGTIAAINSMSGANVSVPSSGGGVNTDNIVKPGQTQSSNNPNNKPIVVHIDNRFDVGNRGAATIASKQYLSTGLYDKTN